MHADLSREQRELASLARELFTGVCPPAAVRSAWEADGAFDAGRWRRLADSDLLGVLVPAAAGGLDLGAVAWTVVLEEAGRHALPEPIVEFAGLAPSLLAAIEGNADVDDWLAGIATGTTRVAVQLDASQLVAHADTADLVVLVRPDTVRLLEPARATWQRVPVADHSLRLFALTSDESAAPAVKVADDARRRVAAMASLSAAAELVGISQGMIDRTVDYVSRRTQFGRPVATFQAVQHRLADCHMKVEMCRPTVWQAAYLLDHDLDAASTAVSVAKAFATEASAFVNDAALQLHGAIGFSWEDDLHLWLKRGLALAPMYGSAEEHRDRLAAELFATDQADGAPEQRPGPVCRGVPR